MDVAHTSPILAAAATIRRLQTGGAGGLARTKATKTNDAAVFTLTV